MRIVPDAGLISTLPWRTLAWERMIVTVATLYCLMCVYGEVQCKHLTFDLPKKKPKNKKKQNTYTAWHEVRASCINGTLRFVVGRRRSRRTCPTGNVQSVIGVQRQREPLHVSFVFVCTRRRTRRHTRRRVFYISVALRKKKKASLVKNVTREMLGFFF